MSQLVLVRHGQAAFMTDNYDRLTELGIEQARMLGRYWAQRQVRFDALISGSLERQRATAEIAATEMRNAGLPVPEVEILPEFNEYDGDGIVRHFLPQLKEKDPELRQLDSAYAAAEDSRAKRRAFQKLFEAVTEKWISGDMLSPEVESFASFHARVSRGVEKLTSGAGSGKRIGVFSSGGAISVAVQLAVQAPQDKVLEFNWRIRNCSLSEVVFSGRRFSLDIFNSVPHLSDESMHTYR